MKSQKILYVAITLSVLLHILFGITIESYLRFLLKKAPLIGEESRYFEVLPYTPAKGAQVLQPPKNARFLGAKNIKPESETMPKLDKFATPRILQEIKPPVETKEQQKQSPLPQPPQIQEKQVTKRETVHESPVGEIKKPSTEKKLPSLDSLIPKTPELIAKMPKEESINLNRGTVKEGKELVIATKEYKYWSYLDKMKRKIELLWQYPEVARVNGLSGSLKINFAVDKTGKLKDVVLLESSGYKFFDDAAMKALKDAAPFAPFPDTWDVERLNIEGTFIYEIKVIR